MGPACSPAGRSKRASTSPVRASCARSTGSLVPAVEDQAAAGGQRRAVGEAAGNGLLAASGRRAPRDLAGLQVDGDQLSPRRGQARSALPGERANDRAVAETRPVPRRRSGSRRGSRPDARPGERDSAGRTAARRSGSKAAPDQFAPPPVPGKQQRSAKARRREQAVVAQAGQERPAQRPVRPALGPEVRFSDAPWQERRGPGWIRLRRPGPFAGDVALRNGPLLDRPQRPPARAVQHEQQSGLRRHDDRVGGPRLTRDPDEERGRGAGRSPTGRGGRVWKCQTSSPELASSATSEFAKRLSPGRSPPKWSGEAEPTGRKTRPRPRSAVMVDQTLAAPAFTPGAGGSVSNRHTRRPSIASNARTAPDGASRRAPSVIEDPTMTRLPDTRGGEVIPYSSGSASGSIPSSSPTTPSRPNPAQTAPVCASSATSRASAVARKMRSRHAPGPGVPSRPERHAAVHESVRVGTTPVDLGVVGPELGAGRGDRARSLARTGC